MPVCLVYILWSWRKPGAAGATTGHRESSHRVFRRVDDITFCWTMEIGKLTDKMEIITNKQTIPDVGTNGG
ncbi:hypothetical protein N7537_009630 [Penicillium hordei]|uniref:Secreted protein n=1 Tax=Penicillium hordei TaxID=40994 RepID=A0AAD6GUY2_9EURO|nr:uncharacterized protein N7537_009630 [Penicillium hordei]KAJ5592726.1 hypothetical protein N7537_009630 [Penicillium hordei]